MGIDIYTTDEGQEWESFVLVCNTKDEPFGTVFKGSREQATEFLQWLPQDARSYEPDKLYSLFQLFKDAQEIGVKIEVQE